GSTDSLWVNGDTAVFGGASGTPGVVSLNDFSVSAAGIIFNVGGYNINTSASSIGATLALSGTPTIAFNGSFAYAISAGINTSTGFTKSGAGTLILSGTNSISGGINVSGGVLQGDVNSLGANDISDSGNVTFNQGAAGAFSNVVSGAGTLTKIGAG